MKPKYKVGEIVFDKNGEQVKVIKFNRNEYIVEPINKRSEKESELFASKLESENYSKVKDLLIDKEKKLDKIKYNKMEINKCKKLIEKFNRKLETAQNKILTLKSFPDRLINSIYNLRDEIYDKKSYIINCKTNSRYLKENIKDIDRDIEELKKEHLIIQLAGIQ